MSATLLLATILTLAADGPEPVAPVLDKDYSVAVNRRARGVGLGFSQGLWGRGFGQSLRVDVPFGRRVGQFFGLRAHGTVVHGKSPRVDGTDRWDGVVLGGLELFGRSAVMGGVVRAYGGGGVYAGGRPQPTATGAQFGLTGGGHMGVEVFVTPRNAFSIEVGAQGPVHALGLDAGARVVGGWSIYFGR